jgi:transposase
MTFYIGLDVHAKRTVYVVQNEEGRVTARGSVVTGGEGFEEIVVKAGSEVGTKVGLESGAQSFWASEVFASMGMCPYVIDAREVRVKSRRPNQKSDSRDAFEICDGLRRGIYTTIVYVPSPEVRELRSVVYRRRHFVRLMTGQVSAAKSVLRSVGVRAVGSLTTLCAWERLLGGLDDSRLRSRVGAHFEVWNTARKQVKFFEDEMSHALAPFQEDYDRLMTIPGVGKITSATYIAVIAAPERFSKSGEVVSYLGLCPSSWDSGDRVIHGPITRRGNGECRTVLVEAAHHAGTPRHPLNPYFTRVASRQGYKKAVVFIASRLARIMYRMWLNGEEFDVRRLNVVAERRERKKVYHYRLRREGERLSA